jgi:hypothetical protein
MPLPTNRWFWATIQVASLESAKSDLPVTRHRELSKIATRENANGPNGQGSWQRKARFGDNGTEFSMVKHESKFQWCLERKS